MRAIILAAGRGSRMQHYTDNIPKCMLELQGRPLISHQISALQSAGIHDIGLVCGYQKEKIIADGITMRFENERWQQTNMVRSLMAANEWLRESPCVVTYSDIFYHSSAVSSLMSTDANIAITYDVNFKKLWTSRFENPLADLETFKLSGGYLTEIGSRAATLNEIQGQYMGLLKITPDGWRQMWEIFDSLSSDEIDKLDMTSLLHHMVKSSCQIRAVPYNDVWGEVDQISDLELYNG